MLQASQTEPSGTTDRIRSFTLLLHTLTPRARVTPVLVTLNAGLYLLMVSLGVNPFSPSGADLAAWGAGYGPLTTSGQWWRLLSAVFLHIGIAHLALNMFVLWDIGRFCERLVGGFGFLVVYLAAGLAGSLASLVWHPEVVSAGASGAVFGLFGLLLAFLARNRASIPMDVQRRFSRSALVFLVLNVIFGLSVKGIDMAAHLGGLAGGLACGLAIAQPLTPQGLQRRTRAALLVACGAALLLGSAVAALPRQPGQAGELARFAALERETLRTFDLGWRRHHDGTLNDAGFADLIQKRILPPWSQGRARIQALHAQAEGGAESLANLEAYMEAREQGFTLLADALRRHDGVQARRAMERLTSALPPRDATTAGAPGP